MKMSKVDKEQEQKWQAESDFDTLLRAEEIRRDEERYNRAIKHGKEKRKQLGNVLKEAD